MIVKMQHTYTWWCTLGGVGIFYTWWCWHIYKGDKVGIDVDQLDDETEARRVRNSTGALYRKDRVSHSAPNTSHAVTGRWGPVSGQWQQ